MVEHLPDAAWTHRPDLVALVEALGAGQCRYVGGAVRDTLLGREVNDIDLATPLLPDQVIARLSAAAIRSVPTGIEHGTVTAVLDGGPVEITTLRQDLETDGRRARVAFAGDWRDDAGRRDFTINALYADPLSGELFDYFGGRKDLADHRVRFIGDASERIREDHLRILRYFRFQARFGSDSIDPASEAACAALAPSLMGLSRERVGMEMMKLLALLDPAPTVTRMAELGVLAVILPEADPSGLAHLTQSEADHGIAPEPIRRLASLLPADVSLAERVAARFRLSGKEKKRLASAAARGTACIDARDLAYRIGRDAAVDRLLLGDGAVGDLADWTPPPFPLKGGEIVARGVTAGPEVARILQRIESRWIKEGFPARRRVEQLLADELAR